MIDCMNLEIQVVTCKQIANILSVSLRTANNYRKKTLKFYNKEEHEPINLGQVLRANNLEK